LPERPGYAPPAPDSRFSTLVPDGAAPEQNLLRQQGCPAEDGGSGQPPSAPAGSPAAAVPPCLHRSPEKLAPRTRGFLLPGSYGGKPPPDTPLHGLKTAFPAAFPTGCR